MLRPAISEKLEEGQSIFSMVMAIAKRAREITDEIESEKKDLIEQNGGKLPSDLGKKDSYLDVKPVRLAVLEFEEERLNFKMKEQTDEC